MDVDLKDLIAQVLTPDLARQLATTVGMDDRQGKTFVDAAIPALLAAFGGALDHPDGAKALSDAVSNSDPNAVEKLKRALIARDLQPLSDGANALTPVLGQGVRDQLANGLATLVDTPIEAALPALGAVEQATVAVIGQLDPFLWSDPGAIRALVSSQKDAVLAAVPPSLASLAGHFGAPPPPPPPSAARPAVVATAPPPPPPPTSGGGWIWLVLLIIVVILAAGGYYYWMKSQEKPASGELRPSWQYALVSPATRFRGDENIRGSVTLSLIARPTSTTDS